MPTKLALILFLLVLIAPAASGQGGLICGDPTDKGCSPQYDGFEANDLTFLTGRAQLGTGTRHESDEFYAVILQSIKAGSAKNRMGCDFITETKRLAEQRLAPHNKAFTSRNGCAGKTIVAYSNVNQDYNFLAIYGGTESQASALLQTLKRRYPQANIRKMRVILDFADQ
jgi:hypothetical protein